MVVHGFEGLSWAEWSSIVVLISSIVGFVAWVLQRVISNVLEPLTRTIDRLAEKVEELNETSIETHKIFAKRLDHHHDKLIRHDEQIKTLFRDVEGDNETQK